MIIVLLAGAAAFCAPSRAAIADDRTWEQLGPEVERLYQEQRYAQLAAIAEEALRAAEHTFGRNDPKVAALIINLSHAQRAVALEAIANYNRSETPLARAIKILEEAHGPDHPEVAAAVNSLGELYSLQADYREAEPLFQRALAVWERTKGPNDPQVAVVLNNLAWLAKVEGRYAEAESLYRRALSIFTRARLTRHPTYAVITKNLRALQKAKAKHAKGPAASFPPESRAASAEEAAVRRNLEALEETLGPNHPNVAEVVKELASFYAARDRAAEAEALYQRALAIDERGGDAEAQKKVVTTLNRLIALCTAQQRHQDARPLYERLLALQERRLGPKNEELVPVLEGYAACLRALGEERAADAAMARADRLRHDSTP